MMTEYRDGHAEARLLRRTIVGFMDFDGRSRRTEFFFYSIATALIGALIEFVGGMILPGMVALVLIVIWGIAAMVPTFALFSRRMHDQGRSAGWTFVYLASLLMQIITIMVSPAGSDEFSFQHPFEWVSAGLFLAVLVLMLLPGTKGPNRYGEDPRISPV